MKDQIVFQVSLARHEGNTYRHYILADSAVSAGRIAGELYPGNPVESIQTCGALEAYQAGNTFVDTRKGKEETA